MRNECKIEVMTYESLFEFNARSVKHIEKNLILKLLELLSPNAIPGTIYKVHNGIGKPPQKDLVNILAALNNAVLEEFKEQQDAQMLKFISTRKKFIDLEMEASKRVDLSMLRLPEDRTLILLIIMLLKNINNLIVELGMLGLQMFLIDLRKDLIQKQSEKFQTRGKDIQKVFSAFIDEMVANSHDADLYAKYLES